MQQRQMQLELDIFMREGLPAIQSILAGGPPGRSLPAALAAPAAAAPAAAAAPSATTTRAPRAPAYDAASFEQTGAGEGVGHPASTSYVDLGVLIGQSGGADPRAVALVSS